MILATFDTEDAVTQLFYLLPRPERCVVVITAPAYRQAKAVLETFAERCRVNGPDAELDRDIDRVTLRCRNVIAVAIPFGTGERLAEVKADHVIVVNVLQMPPGPLARSLAAREAQRPHLAWLAGGVS